MKKALKIVAGILFVLAAVTAGILLYWGREQSIDFSMILPTEIVHCGKSYTPGNSEYDELASWLRSNQPGWKSTIVTYVPRSVYAAPNITINVLKTGVVINYQSKNGSWRQVVRDKKEDELIDMCTKANTTLQPTSALARLIG